MEQLDSRALKAILHSKRANLYYLEHCKVQQKDGRVLFLTEAKNENHYFNIPIANTTVILLGTGTSITNAAVRMLCQAGVMIGFSGGGGTPLFMGTEIQWMTPQSEYRPTEYMQGWMRFWFDDTKKLQAAKEFQIKRIEYIQQVWNKSQDFKQAQLYIEDLKPQLKKFNHAIVKSNNTTQLMSAEALLTKELYKYAAQNTQQPNFSREHGGGDTANNFLNHGNYLAYGLAATALWVLGIPHGFPVMHGTTRRGALVFDVADLIKDAIVLPTAFVCAQEQLDEQSFRHECLSKFTDHKALDWMFDCIKDVILTVGETEITLDEEALSL